ncbi:MAG: glucose-6-phosphate isomerase [Granulosicoccaceae bacterium]
MNIPTKLASWKALEQHRASLEGESLRNLFAQDAQRFDQFQCCAAGLFVDYSKNLINSTTLGLLLNLAKDMQLDKKIAAMMAGEMVNNTEGRPALHSALRNQSADAIKVGGEDVMPGVNRVLDRMAGFCEKVRDGSWQGHTGKTITDVVNIGIGGSDLGPLMATEALAPFAHDRLQLRFVSNVDGSHLVSTLAKVNPETTLFIIASKTFTTQETLSNAHSARNWFLESGAPQAAVAKHFVALSTNSDAVANFGIDTNNMFEFWDWVGGRYSLWSAIGLSIMLSIGSERFRQFLAGAHEMDKHFVDAPLDKNMPVLLALLTVWYNNFYGYTSHMIAPYDQYLHRFPAYLQQLTMESNGKSVHKDGSSVEHSTGPIVWGEPGTNGQHAFFQLLHQGTHVIPVDFIMPIESINPLSNKIGSHHELLLANCFAQSEALMMGKNAQELTLEMHAAGQSNDEIDRLKGHRTFTGNRPSNTIMMQRLDPQALGALIALYENKVYAEAAIWDINPFDQWGVELGKQLANAIHSEIEAADTVTAHDSSTNGLINRAIKFRNLQA